MDLLKARPVPLLEIPEEEKEYDDDDDHDDAE